MANKYRLKGHESFGIREGWLTKGIKAVNDDAKVFSVNGGADILGVGTNMAKSIRYWMRVAGLIEESSQKGVTLSEFGKLVFENDLYLENPVTWWFIHCNIASNFEQATSWNVFYNDFNLTSEFNREEMNSLMMSLLLEKTGEEALPERSVKDDASIILSMYNLRDDGVSDPEDKKNSPLSMLRLIDGDGRKFKKVLPDLSILHESVVLYLIADKMTSEGYVSIDDIVSGYNMPGNLLNLNRVIISEYIDKLLSTKKIIVNRTAGLDMIYPVEGIDYSKTAIVKAYYKGDNE